MDNKQLLFIFVLITLLSGIPNTPISATEHNLVESNVNTNFTKAYQKRVDFGKIHKFEKPDVTSYLSENLTDTSVVNAITYDYDQEISEIDDVYFMVNITVVDIHVINDHDGTLNGAGEIFIEGTANGNYSRVPEIGSEWELNDGESVSTSISLLYTHAAAIDFQFEVREADTADADDSLGFTTISRTDLTNESLELVTDNGDARLLVEITVKPTNEGITGGELLNGYRPYLYVEDETSETEMPDYVVGRVISSDDNGRAALVLQYYFYWNAEYAPDTVSKFKLHDNDFEVLLVYFDQNDLSEPYRVVFNNYIYVSTDPGFPNENLLILEEGVTESKSNFSVDISDQLNLILGASSYQEAHYRPMSDVTDWKYGSVSSKDVRRSSLLGYSSFEMTVETSYHTFDLGPGGNEYGFNYTIDPLNNSLLESWYGELEGTFANGTHEWSYLGVDVPITGPFTHDVTQVFTAPYAISTYSEIVADVGAITRAENSQLEINQTLDLGIEFNFQGNTKVIHPDSVTPGSTSTIEIEMQSTNNIQVTISYSTQTFVNFSYWFVGTETNYTNDGSITFDIDANAVSTVMDQLNLGQFETSDVELGSDYLSLNSLVITPQFIGKLIEGEISLSLWDILKTVVTGQLPAAQLIFKALEYLLDGIDLKANLVLESKVRSNLTSSSEISTQSKSEFEFTEDSMKQTFEIQIPDNANSQVLTFSLSDFIYFMDLTTDWSFYIGFKSPLSSIVDDIDYQIGTFPDLSSDIMTSNGGSFEIEIILETSLTTDDVNFNYGLMVFTFIPVYLIKKLRN